MENWDWRGEIKIRITIKITIEEGEGINHGWSGGLGGMTPRGDYQEGDL